MQDSTIEGLIMNRSLSLVALIAGVGALPLRAQFPPDSLVNLQVLPEDTEVRELIGIMRGFALGLGVRCEHCHVGEEGQPLSTFDFPADEKPTKAKAREMLRMVQAINGEHLANLSERSDPPIDVTCATCHHGLNRPVTLTTVLLQTRADEGIDVAIDQYRRIREQYFGSWTYDFTEATLTDAGQQIGRAHPDDAIEFLNLNSEFCPESPGIYLFLGQIYAIKGDTATAVANLERSLELAPGNPAATRVLRQLGRD